MSKFTAVQARELAGPTIEEKVDKILVAIEQAAKEKQRSLRTGWEYKEDTDLWIDGGYGQTKDYQQAVQILKDLGFKVDFYYCEGSFAVDMYTVISW